MTDEARDEYRQEKKSDEIDITGLDVVQVFRALFEGTPESEPARTPAFILQLIYKGKSLHDGEILEEIKPSWMDKDLLESHGGYYFPDYFRGKPIKVLYKKEGKEQFIERADLYNRDHGEGLCQKIVANLKSKTEERKEKGIKPESIGR